MVKIITILAIMIIQSPNQDFLDGMHEYQIEVADAFDDSVVCVDGDCAADKPVKYFMLEWHRRARKTTLAINLLVKEAMRVPNAKYIYIAPYLKDARNIVWDAPDMLPAALPPQYDEHGQQMWSKNKSNLQITFYNGSILMLYGADRPDSIRGAEVMGVVFDEWALIDKDIWDTMFRPIYAGEIKADKASYSNRWAMFLYTPKGNNHATQMFDDAACLGEGGELPSRGKAVKQRDRYFVSRLTADKSGILNAEALDEVWEDVSRGKLSKAIVEQEYYCARIAEEEMSFITSAAIERLRGVEIHEPLIRRFISCDPATGGDECVVYVFENTHIIGEHVYHHRDAMKVVSELLMLKEQYETDNLTIEVNGLGGPIADRMSQLGWHVVRFDAAEKAYNSSRLMNRKAEAWWNTARRIDMCEIVYPENEMLRQQLTMVKYDFSAAGKMKAEDKKQTKKRLGQSPDRADAWVIGIESEKNFDPVRREKDGYKRKRIGKRYNIEAVAM